MSERMASFPIFDVLEHNESLKSFYFTLPFRADPGQFVMLWLPGVDEKPFSVSAVLVGLTEITVRAVGPFTRRLMECRRGDRLGVRGPFGKGFPIEPGMVLAGGGMGIAPICHLARELGSRGLPFSLLLGARTGQDLIFVPDMMEAGAELFTEDGTVGRKGLVTDGLAEALRRDGVTGVCACGPEAMLAAVWRAAASAGVPCRLALERYMKCGIGVCGQCCLDVSGVRVCREGPVLGAEDLAWVTELGSAHRDASGMRGREGRGGEDRSQRSKVKSKK